MQQYASGLRRKALKMQPLSQLGHLQTFDIGRVRLYADGKVCMAVHPEGLTWLL